MVQLQRDGRAPGHVRVEDDVDLRGEQGEEQRDDREEVARVGEGGFEREAGSAPGDAAPVEDARGGAEEGGGGGREHS